MDISRGRSTRLSPLCKAHEFYINSSVCVCVFARVCVRMCPTCVCSVAPSRLDPCHFSALLLALSGCFSYSELSSFDTDSLAKIQAVFDKRLPPVISENNNSKKRGREREKRSENEAVLKKKKITELPAPSCSWRMRIHTAGGCQAAGFRMKGGTVSKKMQSSETKIKKQKIVQKPTVVS